MFYDELRIDFIRFSFFKKIFATTLFDKFLHIAIIKNMFDRKQERLSNGKMVMAVDEKYFRIAEEQLFSELAFALGMKKEEMLSFIQMKIE